MKSAADPDIDADFSVGCGRHFAHSKLSPTTTTRRRDVRTTRPQEKDGKRKEAGWDSGAPTTQPSKCVPRSSRLSTPADNPTHDNCQTANDDRQSPDSIDNEDVLVDEWE
jgi:hypothetical protein